jgi:methionyl-tRNA formyltransferase
VGIKLTGIIMKKHFEEKSEFLRISNPKGTIMRFAITGCDGSLGVWGEFIRAGWEPVKLFSFSTLDSLESNHKIIEFAQSKHINVQVSRITESDLQNLGEKGCEALIVAGYKWRIGDWRPYLKHAVNFHPSPLPEARGPYPMVRAIIENRKSWAVTCHRLNRDFDTGDILAAETFPLGDSECHESLNLKIQMASGRLANRVVDDFQKLWDQATPQGAGDYWANLTQEDRTISFSASVDTIMRKVRAMGLLECLAQINGVWICVRRAVGWEEVHSLPAGTVAHVNNKTIVVAAQNGYIGIIEWSILSTDLSKVFPQ